MNLTRRAKREVKGSWSTYHLERSERLRNLGEHKTSSEARGYGFLVTLNLERRERLRDLRQPNTSSEAKGYEGLCEATTSEQESDYNND